MTEDLLKTAELAGWHSTMSMLKKLARQKPAMVPYPLICAQRFSSMSGFSGRQTRTTDGW